VFLDNYSECLKKYLLFLALFRSFEAERVQKGLKKKNAFYKHIFGLNLQLSKGRHYKVVKSLHSIPPINMDRQNKRISSLQ
jgi:hypothetical protein